MAESAPENAEARARAIAAALADPRPDAVKGRRRIAVGTGFFIAADKVLTNFHVVENCAVLTVGNNREGAETEATLAAGDRDLDLAVLSVRAMPEVMPARFRTSIAEGTGADLSVVGYPSRGLPVLNAELDPVTAAHADLVSDSAFFPFNGEVRSGNSGSPVLDATGAIVGVVTAKIDTVAVYRATGMLVSDVGFAIANGTVLDFLREANIPVVMAPPGAPLSRDEILARARGFVRQIGCWR